MADHRYVTTTHIGDVPVSIIASPELWIEGTAVDQLHNAARIEGVVRVVGLPDLQPGRGYPVGSVILACERLIPILIDKDIGCGMLFCSLGRLALNRGKLRKRLEAQFFTRRKAFLAPDELLELLSRPRRGLPWLGELFEQTDELLEDVYRAVYGLRDVDPESAGTLLDDELLQSAARDWGSLGSGNHFAEFQQVAEVADSELSNLYQLKRGDTTLLVHTGSRGFGYTLAWRFLARAPETGKAIPLDSEAARGYLAAMQLALNYAALNRLFIQLRLLEYFKWKELRILLDKPHNFLEIITNDGDEGRLVLHRKGAAPAHPAVNDDPLVIPGALGRSSWFAVAGPGADRFLNSVNHGVGRRWNRAHAAAKLHRKAMDKGRRSLTGGVEFICPDGDTLFVEGGDAYKDIDSVMESVVGAGLARPVARLEPQITIKE